MSLATSGGMGGAGGAGLSAATMAHGGPSALATHQAAQSSSSAGPPPGTSAAAPPPNMAALGANLLDKNQNLNGKQIRNVSHLPIVSIDLYGGGDGGNDDDRNAEVAMFSPKKDDSDAAAFSNDSIIQSKSVGSISTTLCVRKEDGSTSSSHRALRRLLTKSKGYETVFRDTLTTKPKGKEEKGGGVKNTSIPSPQLLLGTRHTKDLHPATACHYNLPTSTSEPHAIQEEETDMNNDKVSIRNGNLDGSTTSQDNDYDRITLNLQLHSNKKTLSVLPEEAVSILVAQAKKKALEGTFDLSLHPKKSKKKKSTETEEEDTESSYLEYPVALAIPSWACQDNAIESLSDACHSSTIVLYQRSVAALAGALLPKEVDTGSNKRQLVSQKLFLEIEATKKRYTKKREEEARKKAEEERRKGPSCCNKGGAIKNTNSDRVFLPTVIMAGLTAHGVEYTAIQVGSPNENYGDGHCPLGEFRVIASVAYHHSDPLSISKRTFGEFTDVVDEIYPELEEDGGVAAFVTYGTIGSQVKMKEAIMKSLETIQASSSADGGEGDAVWHTKTPFTSTKEESVALGTAVLAAISHGRIEGEKAEGDDNRLRPSIVVHNVTPCAVGVIYNFHGGNDDSKWTAPKVVFDYDRRVLNNSSSKIEFSASECVAIRKDPSLLDDEEKLYDEAQKWSKGKYNSLREEAALDLRVRVVQKVERNGKWKGVGAVFTALTQKEEEGEDDGDDAKKDEKASDTKGGSLAVETSTLELSLDSVGFIGVTMSSDGQSIVQATKAARSSTFWYWFRIIFAIAFFGGFFLKSFIDDRIREYDVKKILAYYKHACPGTINDGDERNAYYLAWKYMGKKDKLWRRLEAKYDMAVLEVDEWDDEEDVEEEEEVDLDEQETESGNEEEL